MSHQHSPKDYRPRKIERMLRLWLLLLGSPLRFTKKDLAGKFNVCVRTIERSMQCLEKELRVPLYNEKNKWAVEKDYYLPPIRLTWPEALNIFLAARLMLKYSHRYDPNVDSTFNVIAAALPPQLQKQIEKTIEWMRSLPKSEAYLANQAKLAEAWISQKRIRITYRPLGAENSMERLIEPYFIEPVAAGHSSYVIAYCHYKESLRVFKIERIESAVLTSEHYDIPADFDANEHFGSAWGIVAEGEVKTVKLKIRNPHIIRIMEETVWHPSQVVEKQNDGSAIMTLTVTDTEELLGWIMGWGEQMEVLEPPEIREAVIETVEEMREMYKRN